MLRVLRQTTYRARGCLKIAENSVQSRSSSSSASPDYEKLLNAIIEGQRAPLARAITLIESENPTHRAKAQRLVAECIRLNNASEKHNVRIGITGPPGVGKSSFIEVFGQYLIKEQGRQVSVLTIDPSSSRTGGSLLGDKTRMHHLSKNPKAYIRSSPTSGHLGGVCKTTSDSIELVQTAGYDVTLIETVGVGQAEYRIQDMCDCLVLLIPPGGGDELQAVKKGIVEVCDLICVTKADGTLLADARRVAAEYISALKFVRPKILEWRPRVIMTSARTGTGLEKLWSTVTEFTESVGKTNLVEKRAKQRVATMWNFLQEDFMSLARTHCGSIQEEVFRGDLTPGQASEKVLRLLCEKAPLLDGGGGNGKQTVEEVRA